jgi:hypothetical protein
MVDRSYSVPTVSGNHVSSHSVKVVPRTVFGSQFYGG